MSDVINGREAVQGPDGKYRCVWPGSDPLYLAYHDTEWGVPEYDSRALWEKLMLDGFQMLAMRDRSVLPIDFPPLDETGRERLLAWSAAGRQLPVAEFAARGLYDAYFLDLVIAA